MILSRKKDMLKEQAGLNSFLGVFGVIKYNIYNNKTFQLANNATFFK